MARSKIILTPEEEEVLGHLSQAELVAALRKSETLAAENLQNYRRVRAQLKQAEDELEASRNANQLLLATKPKPLSRQITKVLSSTSTVTPILCLTDWHTGAKVKPDVMAGLNEYNLEISRKRAERTFQKAAQLVRLLCPVDLPDRMLCWWGGDLINGNIHEEHAEINELGLVDQMIEVQTMLQMGTEFLAEELSPKVIDIIGSCGNHSRVTEKTRYATEAQNSLEYAMYRQLEKHYENRPQFRFHLTPSYHTRVRVHGLPIRFHHGHRVKSGGAIGGIATSAAKRALTWNTTGAVRWDVFGHFHQFHWYDDHVLCGSLIGYDPYALGEGCRYSPPTQTLLMIHPDHGMVFAIPLFVDKAEIAPEAHWLEM